MRTRLRLSCTNILAEQGRTERRSRHPSTAANGSGALTAAVFRALRPGIISVATAAGARRDERLLLLPRAWFGARDPAAVVPGLLGDRLRHHALLERVAKL